MTGVRRGARAVLRYCVPLLFLLVIVQRALRPLNAFLVFGLFGWLSGQPWRRRAGTARMTREAAPALT